LESCGEEGFFNTKGQRNKGAKKGKTPPVAPFEPLFLCPFVLFFAFPLAALTRLQRKISGKGEPLPDGDSGK